jgi:chromosome segregation ATPase
MRFSQVRPPHFLFARTDAILPAQSAHQAAEQHHGAMQHAQTQLLISQASLVESQEHAAALRSRIAEVDAALVLSRQDSESLKQQLADALERAHLSETHAAQMQHIADHLQSSVSQQVRVCLYVRSYICAFDVANAGAR